MSVFDELRRRNVFRVAAAYLAGAWLVIQLSSTILPLYGFAEAASRLVVTVLVIGFVPVLVLAWVFQLTPEGLKRDQGTAEPTSASGKSVRRFDRTVIVVLALAVALFAVDRFVLDPARDAERLEAATEQARTGALLGSFADKSIAVLPFEDLSAQGDQEYFSDGVAEELLNLLAKIPELRVVARTSSFSFKGKEATIGEIADTLNVAYVLEGSVRRAGDRLRITAQLIQGQTDRHLLSETFDRDMGDIFAIQDEIAAEVVDRLRITLLGPPPVVEETNPEVYALYLQARHINRNQVLESLPLARELLLRAIDLAEYLPARWELGTTYWQLGAFRGEQSEWYEPYRANIDEIQRIWPDSAAAHVGRGMIAFVFDRDFEAAAVAFERALAAEPPNQDVLGTLSNFASALNRPHLVIEIGEYLLARDPLCVLPCYSQTLTAYLQVGEHDKFDATYAAMQALGLDMSLVADVYADSLLHRGDAAGALAQAATIRVDNVRLIITAIAHHRLGQQAEYETALAELREGWPSAPPFVYANTSDLDAAFDFLMSIPGPLPAASFDWQLAPMRAHPRWPELAAKAGIWPTDPREDIRLDVVLPD